VEVRIVKGGRFVRRAVYVGRPTRFGNPYRVEEVGSHEEAVRLYRAWFQERTKDSRFLAALETLYQRLKRENVLTLSCHCVPRPCHAEVIAEWLAERAKGEGLKLTVVKGGEHASET